MHCKPQKCCVSSNTMMFHSHKGTWGWEWQHIYYILNSSKVTCCSLFSFSFLSFLAHLARWAIGIPFLSFVVRPSTFHILMFSSETTGPIATKLWWNGPWMDPFQNCVRWSRLPTKMAAKLKIEKGGMQF